jgi:hypothetical protein
MAKDVPHVIIDQTTKTAVVAMGERIATLPGRVRNQREADLIGREIADCLGWTKSTT